MKIFFICILVFGGQETLPTNKLCNEMPPIISSDDKIQNAIDAAVSCGLRRIGDNENIDDCLIGLREIAEAQSINFVRQFVYYYATTKESGADLKTASVLWNIYESLDIPQKHTAEALYPLLNSQCETLRENAVYWLEWSETSYVNGKRKVSFAPYGEIIAQNSGNMDAGLIALIKYIQKRHPGQMLVTLLDTRDRFAKLKNALKLSANREPELTPKNYLQYSSQWEHSTIQSEIKHLSQSPKWLDRFVASELSKQVPQLREETVLVRLSNDKNPMIKANIKAIGNPPASTAGQPPKK